MKNYYLDACIWRDYFENRSDRFRPLGEWAWMLIKKIIKEDNLFVLSDHLMNELKKHYSQEELTKFFEIIPQVLIIKIETYEKQSKEALKIKNRLKIPFGDALHAVLARDNNAIIVTRDKHFYELTREVIIKKPEDLI